MKKRNQLTVKMLVKPAMRKESVMSQLSVDDMQETTSHYCAIV